MKSKRVICSLPPSLNQLRKTKYGVYRPETYKKAYEGLKPSLIQLEKAPIPCKIFITIREGKGWRWDSDIDNRIKPVLDCMQELGILEEDNSKHVHGVHCVFDPAPDDVRKDPATCEVWWEA